MSPDQIERFAIRIALGNNGGTWAEHYTEAQREHWRQVIRDLERDIRKQILLDTAALRELAQMDDVDHQVPPKL
jgi:exosome complex RNA-binding protein Rrp4